MRSALAFEFVGCLTYWRVFFSSNAGVRSISAPPLFARAPFRTFARAHLLGSKHQEDPANVFINDGHVSNLVGLQCVPGGSSMMVMIVVSSSMATRAMVAAAPSVR